MKIIGKTDDGYILQAESDEVYNLIGFISKYGNDHRLNVGQEIRVAEMFRHLYYLNSHKKRIEEVIANLNNTAVQLKEVEPVLESIKNTTPSKA